MELERHLGGSQNLGIPSCYFYHSPLPRGNMNNLSMAYTKAKPLSHDLSEEDYRHHMAKTHPRHRNFNSCFSSQHLHHPDAIRASLGRSSFTHEWSLPTEESALRRTASEKARLRRPEKMLKRRRSPWNILISPLITGISGVGQRQVLWSCQIWSKSLWKQKKCSNCVAQET